MEKNIKKRVSICVELSHFAVQQRLAQHCKSTILQLKQIKKNKNKRKRNTERNLLFWKTGQWQNGSVNGA